MDEVLFDEEGIKFKYLSNWKEQRKDVIGQNCIKALVKVVEENPSTITIYKNEAGNKNNVADLESDMRRSFENQGWTIVDSKVVTLNDNEVFNIISNAQEGGKTLELQVSAFLNNGYMYIFELMNFKEFPYAYNDYLAILDSVEF
ncbi:MAG: hypothetical protein MJ232_02935 [archaeon]|nr:hypothetical protein [archaeon]